MHVADISTYIHMYIHNNHTRQLRRVRISMCIQTRTHKYVYACSNAHETDGYVDMQICR